MMIPEVEKFSLDYIQAIRTIRKHISLFKSVFVEIIDDYAGSACPNRGFLRHHNHTTSAAGWRGAISAFVKRCIACKVFDDREGAETGIATSILQARFEVVIRFVPPTLNPPLSLFPIHPIPRNTSIHTKPTLIDPSLPNSSSNGSLYSLHSSAHEIRKALSPLQNRLTNSSTAAAAALNSLAHRVDDKEDKDNRGGFWGNMFQETETARAKRKENENKFWWIDADTAVLKRREGDLVDESGVLRNAYVFSFPPLLHSQSRPAPCPLSHPP